MPSFLPLAMRNELPALFDDLNALARVQSELSKGPGSNNPAVSKWKNRTLPAR
ncbi:MAG: hypothetical protein LDL19_05840 [Thiobacillus sp.]|nr:hypothetical protein [Thiobacillus sp.]